jgi:hypothetical protein
VLPDARQGSHESRAALHYPDRAAYQVALARLQTKILHEGGSFTADGLGARVRLHGFTATSTTGLAGACHNWITQVTDKAALASMAAVRS